jgi:hypothetical protein
VASGPRSAVDVDDEQGMRGWAVEQFGEEAVAEQEARGGVASEGGGGSGEGGSIPTHGTADVPQGAEFPERNPLAGEEGEQLQSLESLDSLVDAGSGVPGMASPDDFGSTALPEIREDPAMDRSDIMGIADENDDEIAAEHAKIDAAAAIRQAARDEALKDPEPAKAPAPPEQTWWEKLFGNSGKASEIGKEHLANAAAAAEADPLNTAGKGKGSTVGGQEAASGTISPRGLNLPVTGKGKQGSAKPDNPDGEGTYSDPSGLNRPMIDRLRKMAMDDDPADTGNVDPPPEGDDYDSGEPVAEPDREGIENPSAEYGAGAGTPDVPVNQGGLIDPRDDDGTSIGGDGSYNTDTDITTNVDDGTVDDPTDSGDSGDGYEVVTTFDPNAQPTEPYVDDALPGE